MAFFLETLLGGLMAGMLYSLVALGFVLIFKASGVFNFAQGAMVLFAALAMARFSEWMPLWLDLNNLLLSNLVAFVMAGAVMFVVAWVIERLVLRHLVNQEGATLLMATLGITYFMEGLGQALFGSDVYKIDIGMPKEPIFVLDTFFEGGVLVNKEDVIAAAIAATLVAALSIFFQKTSTGRALRAVADDHQAAQSIGIALNRIWVIVWSVAGVVALVAGSAGLLALDRAFPPRLDRLASSARTQHLLVCGHTGLGRGHILVPGHDISGQSHPYGPTLNA